MAGNPIILSVDDTASVRSIVTRLGNKAGFDVVEAVDGLDGVAKLASLKKAGTPPKLIISDIHMPGMDGYGFIQEVRKSDRSVQILVLTTVNDPASQQKGKAAGANGWILKPINPVDFLATIQRMTAV